MFVIDTHLPLDGRDIERDYTAWIDLNDCNDGAAHRIVMAHIARMANLPLWELCAADDASTHPALVTQLREATAGDPRIKIVRRDRNGHISAAFNSGLGLATGQFVALMDHDDLLAPHALYEVASLITHCPDVDVLYSDEDLSMTPVVAPCPTSNRTGTRS